MAKKIARNTYVDMELDTGETVKLTLTFGALLQLKTKHAEDYSEYNRIMTKGVTDELDMVRIIYTAYLCGLMMRDGDTDGADTFEEFATVISPDREYLGEIVAKLIRPKKAMASGDRS